jgi:hypothetical protein
VMLLRAENPQAKPAHEGAGADIAAEPIGA